MIVNITSKERVYYNRETKETISIDIKRTDKSVVLIKGTEITSLSKPDFFDSTADLNSAISSSLGLKVECFISEKMFFTSDEGYHGTVYRFNGRKGLYVDAFDSTNECILSCYEITDEFGITVRICEKLADAIKKELKMVSKP